MHRRPRLIWRIRWVNRRIQYERAQGFLPPIQEEELKQEGLEWAVPVVSEDFPESDDSLDMEQYFYFVRSLWVGVIRRAIRDWVLNRRSKKLAKRAVARDAYIWLFVENSEHVHWKERGEEGVIMSFLGLCDALSLDPDELRGGIKLLNKDSLKSRMSDTRTITESDGNGDSSIPMGGLCLPLATYESLAEEPPWYESTSFGEEQ